MTNLSLEEETQQRQVRSEDDDEEGALPVLPPQRSVSPPHSLDVPSGDETSRITDLQCIEYNTSNANGNLLYPSEVDVDDLIEHMMANINNPQQEANDNGNPSSSNSGHDDPANPSTSSSSTTSCVPDQTSDADKATEIARQDWQDKFGATTTTSSDTGTTVLISHSNTTMEMSSSKEEVALHVVDIPDSFKDLNSAMLLPDTNNDGNNNDEALVPPGAVAVTGSYTARQLYPVQTISQPTSDNHPNVETTPPPQVETLLEATLVEHDNHHHTNTKLVEAEALVCGQFSKKQLWYLSSGLLVCLLLVSAVVVAVTMTVTTGTNEKDNINSHPSSLAPTPTPRPTLELIRERGVLRCGIWKESLDFFNLVGAYDQPEDQVDQVLCRAYAAAILGNASRHEIVLTSQEANLQLLQNGTIDLLLSHVETGMQADVWESANNVNAGFTFSVPYVYTDLVYGGLPEYVACADDNMNARGNCSGLSICTNDKTAYFEAIASKLPESHLVKLNDTLGIVFGFVGGRCNVLPSENSGIMEWGLGLLGYKGEYVRGTVPFAKDVVTVATRDDDAEFSDFVNIILMGLFAAEQANITRDDDDSMALVQSARVLGNELAHAVRAVGSYRDVYEQGVSPIMKREVWNLINNGTTGLLYALPFGKLSNDGPGPTPGGTLDRIWKRPDRKLHCGIRLGREGFADLDDAGVSVGMDVDFCTALAASAIEGEAQSIEFVEVMDEADGYQKLQRGEVDVLAGFEWNIVNDYSEQTTGEGYAFSQPYFYNPVADRASFNSSVFLEDGDNRCLVTKQDDPQFASFVFWVVEAIIYAEEQGITQATANDMVDVNLYGENFSKMFRDAIYFAGSYGEIFDRNLGNLFLERGRNAINLVKAPGPQIYVPPGYF
ncbi:extracellular solute-binding protein [Seminavis robusta]|uniref:Extracellular solute-binding protein n=1 Tax=Seminavis robusta TaxID=568900 RepID=A0A9N8EPT6_9STRA|nr:extracellular solute-binding protein [Seminavis robusta]|eukprot:Sro1724_g293720.1 extracellular solute-binding protein (891) ;mRNA; f:16382-19337